MGTDLIVGIGVSVWDCVSRIESYPERGAVIRASDRSEGIGGGITVAIAAAARLGTATALIDALGDDDASDSIVAALEKVNVNLKCVQRYHNLSASRASIWADEATSERTIVFSPGTACDQLNWDGKIESTIAGAGILHLNGRHPTVCKQAISLAKRHGVRVSFDGGAHRYRDEVRPFLESAEIVIVAKQFAESHFRFKHPDQAVPNASGLATFLMNDLDCEIVGVTEGAGGSHFVESGGEVFHQTAVQVDQVVDSTGCGDTFHGAFLHAFAKGRSCKQSAAFAARVAAINAQAMGALSNWPRRPIEYED